MASAFLEKWLDGYFILFETVLMIKNRQLYIFFLLVAYIF